MLFKKLSICIILTCIAFGVSNAQEGKDKIKNIAFQFVEAADKQNGKMLESILAPESIQYIASGDKLNALSGTQYISLINAKKIGGKPRKVNIQAAEYIGEKFAIVILNAVSSERNFLYQLSLTKSQDGQWVIIGITTEVNTI